MHDNRDDVPDTVPFRVMLTRQDHEKDDMEIALEEIMLEEDDHDAALLAKRRRLMPGAGTHAQDCKRMFQRSLDIIKTTLDSYGADICLQPNTVMQNTRNMISSLQMKYPWMSEQVQRLIMIAAHMTTGKISDKPMLPDAAAISWMVEGDRHMRVHKGFLFVYDDDGCFMPFGGIPPEAVLHRVHDFFCCLEGIFRRMKPEIARDGTSVADAIAADLQSCETEADYLTLCRTATSRRSQAPAYSQRLDAEEEGAPRHDRTGQEAADDWALDIGVPEEFIRECENAIQKRTSFLVKIVPKKHFSFIDLVKTRSTHANALKNVPDIMFQPGNCIPCALWHVVPLSRPAIVAAVSNTSLPKNVEAKSARYRDCRSVASMCSVDLSSCLGTPGSHVKSFLMHYEGHGLPHSIAVRVDASGNGVTIIDGATVYKLNIATLHEIHCAGVDHSTIVSYWKKDPQDKKNDRSATLLDMVAGARDAPEDSEEDSSQDAAEVRVTEVPNKLSFDEDNVPVFNDNILESLKNETSDIANDLQKKSTRSEGRRHCPLCPFRSFTQLRLLLTYTAKHHTNQNQYVCSGTKQIKVILALYDHAASSQSVAANLLQESATIIRQTVQPPLQGNHNSIDKQIRLVFDAAGPKCVNVSNIGSDLQVRRVRNLYYTHSFADLLLREVVLNHAQDIVTAPIFLEKMEAMNRVLLEQDERHLVMTQRGEDSSPSGVELVRSCFCILFRIQNESADQVVDAMAQNFSADQLRAVVHVGTDQPSEKLFNELKAIRPSMRSLVLDPIHLAIVYEYGFWNKHSPGSKQLRRILQKCISIDADLGQDQWGTFYDGTNARPLTEDEMKYREMISDSSMDSRECNGVLDSLDANVPFSTRLEFIQCLAALCRRYPAEVNRKVAGANKQISKILWSACAPDRLEWPMNNLRVRHALPSSYQWSLPSGTSSNEALHAEINSWSRSINVIHGSTLGMKLKYFSYIKLLLHYLSVQYPLSHTVSASMMLSRSLHRSLWSEDDWNAWCAEQSSHRVPKKAMLPLSTARQLEARLVREHVLKKPASKKQGNTNRKRRVTPLSVKRIHTLRGAGVKAQRQG
ncbi:unnamed protein product [Symbiodinium sp. KB8]|nr:unnamed protein product [Symbiodinium sp. KB8]